MPVLQDRPVDQTTGNGTNRPVPIIEARGISRIICLGDIVGYGPEPLECVDMVAEVCEWALMGNHDFGVLYEPTNFNPGAAPEDIIRGVLWDVRRFTGLAKLPDDQTLIVMRVR